MQEKLLSGRLASICSPTRRSWEKVNFFGSVPDIYKKSSTGYCCQHGMYSYGSVSHCQERKSSSPIKEHLHVDSLYFVCLFNGGTVPWYITMKKLPSDGQYLGTGAWEQDYRCFNVNPCSELF